MALTTLKPKLPTLDTRQVKTLDTKAGATKRIGGDAWMKTRQRVALAHGYRCVDCGLVWRSHIDHIDHDVPLEQGGSNDDSNLRPRCIVCHQAKTTREQRVRFGKT